MSFQVGIACLLPWVVTREKVPLGDEIFWLSTELKNKLIWGPNSVDCQTVSPSQLGYCEGGSHHLFDMSRREYDYMNCMYAVHKFKMLDIVYNTSQWYESATAQKMDCAEHLHSLAELSQKRYWKCDLHPNSWALATWGASRPCPHNQ